MPLASNLSPAYPARAPRGAAEKLRAWQQSALDEYLARQPRDFLTVATPGAGKTTYALRLAAELLDRRTVERIVVVAPSRSTRTSRVRAARPARTTRASRSPTPASPPTRCCTGAAPRTAKRW